MRPLPPEFPAANVRWALDVLSLRKFFSSDPLDTLNQTRVFAVDDETTLTDEELVALHHLGRLTPDGVREFAAERRALLRAFRHRKDRQPRPMPFGPATNDRPRAKAAAAAAGAGVGTGPSLGAAIVAPASPKSRTSKGSPKRGE
jgi:hypothetical protein